jgi:branched-chain amino acid transport system ATP-binding protein
MALLRVEAVSKAFGGLRALDNVSLEVSEGSIKGIIGPNGAGKTTLFNVIAGSLDATSGSVYLDDKPIGGRAPHEIAASGILRTFQTIKLSSNMTVLENVMIGRHIRSRAGFLASMLRLPSTFKEEREIRMKALESLAELQIAELADHDAVSLPFGRQRATELARALAGQPRLLLLDEPASGLNIHETDELADLIRRIRDRGITILLVEHDMSLVMDVCDELSVLNFGEKIAEGTPREIQRSNAVIDVYLGA